MNDLCKRRMFEKHNSFLQMLNAPHKRKVSINNNIIKYYNHLGHCLFPFILPLQVCQRKKDDLQNSKTSGNHQDDDDWSYGGAYPALAVADAAREQTEWRDHGRRRLLSSTRCNNNIDGKKRKNSNSSLLHLRQLQVGHLLQGLSFCGKETRTAPHVGRTDLFATGGFPNHQR